MQDHPGPFRPGLYGSSGSAISCKPHVIKTRRSSTPAVHPWELGIDRTYFGQLAGEESGNDVVAEPAKFLPCRSYRGSQTLGHMHERLARMAIDKSSHATNHTASNLCSGCYATDPTQQR